MLSIVTCVFDTLEITKKCLLAVEKNTDVEYEHIVIFNHPPEEVKGYAGVKDFVFRYCEKENVKLLDYGKNVGTNVGCFRGFQEAKYDYLCKLDNDTIVPPKWASKMVKALEDIPELGFISSYLSKDMQPWPREKRKINGHVIEIQPHNKITFSCVIFRRKIYEEILPFSEVASRYYGLEEDKAFCYCKEHGILGAHYPAVICDHLARTGDNNLYGDWKLAYIRRQTDKPFEEWVKECNTGKARNIG